MGIHTKPVIDYPPEALRTFRLYTYEWIDNLDFLLDPRDQLPPEKVENYLRIVHGIFKAAGWEETGEIRLLWLPPFIFNPTHYDHTHGVTVWHVKQIEDGISWMLSPVELPNCYGGEVTGSESEVYERRLKAEQELERIFSDEPSQT